MGNRLYSVIIEYKYSCVINVCVKYANILSLLVLISLAYESGDSVGGGINSHWPRSKSAGRRSRGFAEPMTAGRWVFQSGLVAGTKRVEEPADDAQKLACKSL